MKKCIKPRKFLLLVIGISADAEFEFACNQGYWQQWQTTMFESRSSSSSKFLSEIILKNQFDKIVETVVGQFGTGQFGTGQFGTRTIWHQDNLAPDNLAPGQKK